MRSIVATCLLILSTSASLASAQAPQPQPIAAPADAPFAHKASRMNLPPSLTGFSRTKLVENEAPQLDITAEYTSGGVDEVVTVFVYRATAGAVPVWFDRATWAIETRGIFGTPVRADRPLTFTPPGQTRESGMRAAWMLAGSRYRSTALAIVPMGEWLVKLRLSSVSLDAAAIEARMNTALHGLGWPAKIPDADTAIPVTPCATPLTLDGSAKPAERDNAAALLAAMLPTAPAKPASGSPSRWCRDSTQVAIGGVYRADAANDRYFLALSDAGRGVWVGPSAAAAILRDSRKPSWSVDLILPGRTVSYAAQDRLPAPGQVVTMLQGRFVSQTGTWGDKREISLSRGALR